MSGDQEDFEKFDQIKFDVEGILKKIKATQTEIKNSLDKENKSLLLKDVENIQNYITEFKHNFLNKVEGNIKSIVNKVSTSDEHIKQLQKKIEYIRDKKINN